MAIHYYYSTYLYISPTNIKEEKYVFHKINLFSISFAEDRIISEKIAGDNTRLNIQMIQLSCTNFIKIYNSLLLLILSKIGFLINFKLLKFYFSEERVFNTKLMKCQNYLLPTSWILISSCGLSCYFPPEFLPKYIPRICFSFILILRLRRRGIESCMSSH